MIYLLEDDSAIRELVVYTLCSTGLEATGFAAPSEFYDAMERALPELLILDIMLPGNRPFVAPQCRYSGPPAPGK